MLRRYQKRKKPIDAPGVVLHAVIDALVDSFFPILADFDDRIDELGNETLLRASDEQLQEIFATKRLLVGMRKAVTPAQCRDEATGSDRGHLPAAHLHHRFFGQNFGWMVGRIASWPEFLGLGIGTELVALAFLLVLFKRRGWF